MADIALTSGFARADDGQQLFWKAVGQGPSLVCCNGVGVSIFFWKYLVEHFRTTHRVILWDYRGHGRSSVPPDPFSADLSMPRNARDLDAVLEAAGVDEPVVVIGHSMGTQVCLEFAHQRPHHVAGIITLFGTYRAPLETLFDSPYSQWGFRALHRAARTLGRPGLRAVRPLLENAIAASLSKDLGVVDRSAHRADIARYIRHLNHMDKRVFLTMVRAMNDHDLTDVLPTLGAPALVVGAEGDTFIPLAQVQRLAELLPHAELFVIDQGTHAGLIEYPEAIHHRIERFFADQLPGFARPVGA